MFFLSFRDDENYPKKITFIFRVLHECRVLRKKGRRKKSQQRKKWARDLFTSVTSPRIQTPTRNAHAKKKVFDSESQSFI